MHYKKTLLLIGIGASMISAAACAKLEQTSVTSEKQVAVSEEPTPISQEGIASVAEASVKKITKKKQSTSSKISTPVVKRISMTASNFSFSPSTLSVKKGDTVILTIKGQEGTHGLAIPDFKVSKQITEGDTVTVQFIADKTGTFIFFCNIPCGEGHNKMKGTITVS